MRRSQIVKHLASKQSKRIEQFRLYHERVHSIKDVRSIINCVCKMFVGRCNTDDIQQDIKDEVSRVAQLIAGSVGVPLDMLKPEIRSLSGAERSQLINEMNEKLIGE